MCPFRLLAVIFLQVTLADGFNTTTFTLFLTPRVTWQTAVTFCRDRGLDLLRVTSQEEQDFITLQAQPGTIWYTRLPDETWSSLYDPDPSTPGEGFQWRLAEADQCQPLNSTDQWTNWHTEEVPSDSPVNTTVCVKLTWTGVPGYKWRTADCNVTFQKVICRSQRGLCDTYIKIHDQSVSLRSIDATKHVLSDPKTDDECRQACTQVKSVKTHGCYAAVWYPNKECELHTASTPDMLFKEAPNGTVTYRRSCFWATLITAKFDIEPEPFNPSCAGASDTTVATTNTSNSSTTTMSESTLVPTTLSEPTAMATTMSESTLVPTTMSESTLAPTTISESTLGPTTMMPITTVDSATTSFPMTTAKVEESTTAPRQETPWLGATLPTTGTVTEDSSSTPSPPLPTSITTQQKPEPRSTTTTLSTTTTAQGNKDKEPRTDTLQMTSTTTMNWSSTQSSSVTPKKKPAAKLCMCSTCTWEMRNSSILAEQQKALSRLLETLAVDHKNTASYKRKYTSAPDPRRSAQTIGYVGVVVLVMVVAVIVSLDLTGVCCDRAQRVQPHSDTASVGRKGQ